KDGAVRGAGIPRIIGHAVALALGRDHPAADRLQCRLGHRCQERVGRVPGGLIICVKTLGPADRRLNCFCVDGGYGRGQSLAWLRLHGRRGRRGASECKSEPAYQTSSMATAVASPPPMHRLAMPRALPWRCSAAISVVMMRVPLAPMGWPSAVAPPCTLILSRGMPRSCMANIATQAKASLISNRSTSPIVQLALARTLLIAPIGAMVKSLGSCACAACATKIG